MTDILAAIGHSAGYDQGFADGADNVTSDWERTIRDVVQEVDMATENIRPNNVASYIEALGDGVRILRDEREDLAIWLERKRQAYVDAVADEALGNGDQWRCDIAAAHASAYRAVLKKVKWMELGMAKA